MLKRRLDLWLPSYVLAAPSRAIGRARRKGRLTHVLFLICDHYEPRHHVKRPEQAMERVATWQREYARFQGECRARFGNFPLHTWFYPPHHGREHLEALSAMVHAGLGEVELHYHHDNDTAETLRADLNRVLNDYHRWGLLLGMGDPPRPGFGFVHGDWALDNSRQGRFCGVNGELAILEDLGCWGDFTMPSADESQTRKINSIYYAVGDPAHSKSHDWGKDAKAGPGRGKGLFLMQGPLGINWRAPGYPRIENASLTSSNWGRADRIAKWIDCQVHVKGRPEWLFVKLHTHGAVEQDFDALFGQKALEMHRVLNAQYNDGVRFKLHYVTARQAYNVARAAEDGKRGDPSAWLDYAVPPPAHRFYSLSAPHDLKVCHSEQLKIENIATGISVHLQNRVGAVTGLRGSVCAVEISATHGEVRLQTKSNQEIVLALDAGFEMQPVSGARILETSIEAGRPSVRVLVEGEGILRYRSSKGPPTTRHSSGYLAS